MFGKKENDMAKSNGNLTTTGLNSINSLSKGTSIEGTIKAESDIRIDGTLMGNLDCKGKIIVGPTGVLDGVITCQNAVIEGTVKGNLIVKQQLHVKETAKINGEIVTDKLIVQAGALFNVKCQMGGQVLAGFNKDKKEAIAS